MTRRTSFIAGAMALAAAIASPGVVSAQARTVDRYTFGQPEGRLMGFYSAALAFTGGTSALALERGNVALTLELAYIPHLDEAQRTAGFDKPESSNLAPVLPRPRVSYALPRAFRIEGSWIPPARVFDAGAHLWSVGASRDVDVRTVVLTARLSVLGGRIRGAITCGEHLQDGSQSDQVYYANVCHGNASNDFFDPRHLSAELIATRAVAGSRLRPFAGAGVRAERLRFDIGVIRANGSRDLDHPVLEMKSSRPFALAGAAWTASGRVSSIAEVLFAPGSLITARLYGSFTLR